MFVGKILERMQDQSKGMFFVVEIVDNNEEDIKRAEQLKEKGCNIIIEHITQKEKDRREQERKELWGKYKHMFEKTIDK